MDRLGNHEDLSKLLGVRAHSIRGRFEKTTDRVNWGYLRPNGYAHRNGGISTLHLEERAMAAPHKIVRGSADPTDLADLLRRCARGDESAFVGFYDVTAPRAWGLALRVVRNRAQTEEVLQEAYLTAWRQSSRYDPARGRASSWFLTIVHRTAVDRVRSAQASSRREQTYAAQRYADRESDETAAAAHGSFEARGMRGALAALTDLQRQAVELAYWGGCTHTEVAKILGIPLGTAKTRIRDGLVRLRGMLGAMDQSSGEARST